jgi:uncharacterized protein
MTDRPLILVLLRTISAEQIRPTLDEFEVESLPETFTSKLNAVASIADRHPALLIVEFAQPLDWIAEVRSNPATRRIPMIGIASEPDSERRAIQAKTNVVFTPQELLAGLPENVTSHARIFNQAETLRDQCNEPLPAPVLKGLHEFNSGEYYEAHETLEGVWMHESGPVREVYRAVLQIGIAYYQITRGNYQGARKMFLRSLQWFANLPDQCQGIDVAKLREDAAAAREHLELLGPIRINEFDRTLLKPVSYEELSRE